MMLDAIRAYDTVPFNVTYKVLREGLQLGDTMCNVIDGLYDGGGFVNYGGWMDRHGTSPVPAF